MELKDRVTEFLKTNPARKAREIASALGVEVKAINSVLYRHKGRVFEQLDGFRWRLAGADRVRAESTTTGHARVPPSSLGNLCRYYLACLARDMDRDLSEFASSYKDLDYAELSALPMLAENPSDPWSSAGAQRVLTRFRQQRRQLALFVGYPARLYHIHAKSGWEGYRVEPLFVFEYKLNEQRGDPIVIDDRPDINLRALRRLSGAEGAEVFDESLQLQEELQLGSGVASIEETFEQLPGLRPTWNWREPIEPTALCSTPMLSEAAEDGIYNRAIVLTAERSPFTRGLEEELKQLETLTPEQYAKTALGAWVQEVPFDVALGTPEDPLLEVVPLNREQRQVVRDALSKPLTVVTGPPGTGKSQLVTSIIVNCAWRGQKVLFASKTNKAVDVVEARVNAFGPRPVLLRLGGANEYRTRLAQYLGSLLAATCGPDDELSFQKALNGYKQTAAERDPRQTMITQLVAHRNRLDEIDQQIEPLRTELGREALRMLGDVDLSTHLAALRQAQEALRRADHRTCGIVANLLWPLVKGSRLRQARESVVELVGAADKLALQNLLPEGAAPNLERMSAMVSAIAERLGQIGTLKEYFRLLAELSDLPSLEGVARRSLEIDAELSDVSGQLWNLWLRLQPGRLTPTDRASLADYKALLELITQANEDKTRLGKEVFRRFYELFPKLGRFLSAWAVTNLAARGSLPMEPAFFDVLIIDEASQCDIPSVLPLLYRCRRAVILGDPKQLRHITHITPQADQQLLSEHKVLEWAPRWSYRANSLYDLAAAFTRSVTLRDHFRSDAEIIAFSNEYFYKGEELRVATRYDRLRRPQPPTPVVRWIHITGRVVRPPQGGAVNDAEAKAVIAEIHRLLVDQRYDGTIGVVSPFRAQANRIRDLVHQNDSILRSLGQSDLLIDTVYKFQGDERDVIIFSPVVSTDTPRTATGFLSGNPNTFNVAITRARASLIAVGDRSACIGSGVQHLEAFARYASDEHRSPADDTRAAVDLGPEYPCIARPERVSDWERFFYKRLYEHGLRPIPQWSEEQYDLDFALLIGNRKLDIEVDGEHHRAWNGELAYRDQLRNRRLIELGWDIMRFWVYQIRDDTEGCIRRVCLWLEGTGKDTP